MRRSWTPELERNPERSRRRFGPRASPADAPPKLSCLAEHAAPGGFAPRRVTPAGVRALLRGKPPREPRPRARALTLLEYCAPRPIVDEDAAGSAAALEGLPLVPLADGSHGVVRARGAPGAALMIVPASVEEVRLMRNAGDLRVDVERRRAAREGGGQTMKARGRADGAARRAGENRALNLLDARRGPSPRSCRGSCRAVPGKNASVARGGEMPRAPPAASLQELRSVARARKTSRRSGRGRAWTSS